MNIDCFDDFMDIIKKNFEIESLLDDLDLELELEATTIDLNVSAISKSYCMSLSPLFIRYHHSFVSLSICWVCLSIFFFREEEVH